MSSKGIDEDEAKFFLNGNGLPTLDHLDRDILDGDILPDEIKVAIINFQKKKTPGSDGIPIEFYQEFEQELNPILRKLFKQIFENGELSESMYHGVISQIYKQKGDRNLLKNWRPLTMLNVDYKMKCLLNRMKLVVEKLVNPNQNCSIPGRDIRDGVTTMINLIDSCENTESAMILSGDQEAAFDVAEWEYLQLTLEAFRFSNNFTRWIRIIYRLGYVTSSVNINGFLSAPFKPSRGLRHGCSLSALLYVLFNETFCQKIRSEVDT